MLLGGSALAGSLSKAQEGQVYDQAVHILGGNANIIARWVGDIRYAVIGDTAHQASVIVDETLQDIAVQTGLRQLKVNHPFATPEAYLDAVLSSPEFASTACDESVKAADKRGDSDTKAIPDTNDSPEQDVNENDLCANFVVIISSQTTMQKLADAIPLRKVYQQAFDRSDDIKCFFAPFLNASMVIGRAFVYMREDLEPAMQGTCLREEIYQSFGLFNDFSGSTFYSFNNEVRPKQITEYDRALLRSIYDPQYGPGAPVFAVMKRFMEILEIDPFKE